MRQYNIFISHSWAYTDAYEKLTKMLDADPRFNYKDYSVPKDCRVPQTSDTILNHY